MRFWWVPGWSWLGLQFPHTTDEDAHKFMRQKNPRRVGASRRVGKQTQEPHRCSHYFFYVLYLLINWTTGSENESYELPGAVRPQDRRESEQVDFEHDVCVCVSRRHLSHVSDFQLLARFSLLLNCAANTSPSFLPSFCSWGISPRSLRQSAA